MALEEGDKLYISVEYKPGLGISKENFSLVVGKVPVVAQYIDNFFVVGYEEKEITSINKDAILRITTKMVKNPGKNLADLFG